MIPVTGVLCDKYVICRDDIFIDIESEAIERGGSIEISKIVFPLIIVALFHSEC